MKHVTLRFGLAMLLLSLASVLSAEEVTTVIDICTVCHGEDGSGAGYEDVPIIAGIPAPHIEEALYAYLDGARQCATEPEMCTALDTLTDEDIAAVADHYAAQPRINSGETYNKHLAEAGERLHVQHCARCHVLPTDEAVEFALGIPLHGQRSAYLRYAFDAYLNGERLTLIPQMAAAIDVIDGDDFEALVNYYASYQPPQP